MDEAVMKSVAAQLRKPEGEYGIQTGEKMNEGNRHINLNAIEALQLQTGDHVLEIGMGNGFFVKNLLSKDDGIQYAGCDYSALMVEEALKINESFINNGQASFHVVDAAHLPFADETFSKTLTINTIYFWNDPAIELQEIRRVLKPGGILVVGIRPKSSMQYLPFTKYGFNMFSKEELEGLLSANGFTITDAVEQQEPDAEIGGEKIPMFCLLVISRKNEV